MVRYSLLLSLATLPALSACNQPAADSETADDYARRINAPSQQPAQPTSAEGAHRAPASNGVSAAGTLAEDTSGDPRPTECGAGTLTRYVGQSYTVEIGQAINAALPQGSTARVLPPGSMSAITGQVSRLNVMIDNDGVIRDLRCG